VPQYEHADRCMIEAEQTLWIVHEALSQIEHSGSFTGRIQDCRREIEKIAKELLEYNDQFEE